MDEQQTTKHLLNTVTGIRKKHEEIAKVTGENFNIFRILGLTTNEVRTHSAFLAELLNPDGNHGQKDIFLKLFLSQIGINFDTNNVTVVVEKHTGIINKEYTEGGYIDILIANKTHAIIIENKIYAGDQWKQLERYSNYASNRYLEAAIIYLTLDGKNASEESIGAMDKSKFNYINLSYKDDIIMWLDLCKKEASSFPILRETITQYINLIKFLTHQSTNKIQEMEINKLLLDSEENFKSAEIIAVAIGQIKNVIETCELELIEKWKTIYGAKDVELFRINDYVFYAKPSYEDRYFHFDLFPLKGQTWGNADRDEFKIIRNLALQFEGRDKNYFWFNNNYSVWLRIKTDLAKISYQECKLLNENRTEWLNNSLNEGIEFANYIITEVKKLGKAEIIINANIFPLKHSHNNV